MKALILASILSVPPIWVMAAHGHLSVQVINDEGVALGWLNTVRQTQLYSCGPALIASVAQSAGLQQSEFHLISRAKVLQGGISLTEFRRLASDIEWHGSWFAGTYENLLLTRLPVAVHLRKPNNHFVLIHHLTDSHALIEDPDAGFANVNRAMFENRWSGYFYAPEGT